MADQSEDVVVHDIDHRGDCLSETDHRDGFVDGHDIDHRGYGLSETDHRDDVVDGHDIDHRGDSGDIAVHHGDRNTAVYDIDHCGGRDIGVHRDGLEGHHDILRGGRDIAVHRDGLEGHHDILRGGRDIAVHRDGRDIAVLDVVHRCGLDRHHDILDFRCVVAEDVVIVGLYYQQHLGMWPFAMAAALFVLPWCSGRNVTNKLRKCTTWLHSKQ